jgi:ATP-dependent Clp protease adaptor protein ClpS
MTSITKNKPQTPDNEMDLLLAVRTTTKKPSLYTVLLMDDDYTPMDFVVDVLMRFFNKSAAEAERLMLQVHQTGSGVCGVYTYEVAETKVGEVLAFGAKHQHPLQCIMKRD